jgi:Leu/Phe-tRNA-protein transferase
MAAKFDLEITDAQQRGVFLMEASDMRLRWVEVERCG